MRYRSSTVEIYRSLLHGALCVVPPSGHATMRDHAAEFDRIVDQFFAKQEAKAKRVGLSGSTTPPDRGPDSRQRAGG